MNTTTPGASVSDGPAWFKSSYCSGGFQDCVEVVACPSAVHVRDSKDVGGPQLTVAPGAWAAFVGRAAEETVA